MQKFTLNDISKIENLMYQKALDLDVSLFNYDFNHMPQEYVIYALSMYQNKDGGFGHGLDHDNYNTNSTAYQTFVALDTIYNAGYKNYKENEELFDMLNRAFNYLYNRALPMDMLWNQRDKSNDGFACAARFIDHGESKDYFPTAGILGYTFYFLEPTKVYYKKALKMLDNAIDYYLNYDNLSYDLLNAYHILYRAIKIKNITFPKLEEFNLKFLEDRKKYTLNLNITLENYQEIPSLYDETPEGEEGDKLNLSLDKIFEFRASHGLWDMNHEWGNKYPEFDTASLKWVGTISRINLHNLKKFNRIEE